MKKEKPYNPTVAWNRERKKLKIIFEQKGITSCEIKMSGCWRNSALGFAHLHKRIWYFKKENRDLLGYYYWCAIFVIWLSRAEREQPRKFLKDLENDYIIRTTSINKPYIRLSL